jgi:hypothetical protein
MGGWADLASSIQHPASGIGRRGKAPLRFRSEFVPGSMGVEASMINRMIHGDVHELRLNRPPVNALSPDLLQFKCGGRRRRELGR